MKLRDIIKRYDLYISFGSIILIIRFILNYFSTNDYFLYISNTLLLIGLLLILTGVISGIYTLYKWRNLEIPWKQKEKCLIYIILGIMIIILTGWMYVLYMKIISKLQALDLIVQ